jgi:hypothetical protein
MSIDYNFGADTSMSVPECKDLLKRELGLWVPPKNPHLWLVNDGTTIVVRAASETFAQGELYREAYGFLPQIVIMMRPTLSGPCYDQSMQTIMRVVDLMLLKTDGDCGFSYECERVLLLRRNGHVFVRENYFDHINPEQLAYITTPYQFKHLEP